MSNKSEIIEQALCPSAELPNNSLKECDVKLDDLTIIKVLVIKSENEISCLAARCTHYSVPLKMGVLFKGRLRCMAHGACFDAKTGDIEDFPGPDCLPKFDVYIRDGIVFIKATREQLESKTRLKTPKPIREKSFFKIPTFNSPSKSPNSPKTLIIGSGAAGSTCADVLHEHGLTDITILTADFELPYDRPKLSKKLDVNFEECKIRNEDFYAKSGIKFVRGQKAVNVDFEKKIVKSNSGDLYAYDKLVIATGLKANRVDKPGNDLKGIFTLRSLADANNIRDYFDNKIKKSNCKPLNVILIGGSFISMETASYFIEKKANTLVMGRSAPFEKTFGKKVSQKIIQLHESNGVKFYNDKNFEIKSFNGNSGEICEIELISGEKFKCDLILLALGGKACTEFISGLEMTKSGMVVVDAKMQTSLKDVYAAGDITSFPRACLPGLDLEKNGDKISIGHWGFASSQGRAAALSIANPSESTLKVVPFFWSSQFGRNIRFSGYADKFDSIIFHDDLTKENPFKFVAFYVFMGKVVGVCSLAWDPMCARFAELLYNGIEVGVNDIEMDPNGLAKLLV